MKTLRFAPLLVLMLLAYAPAHAEPAQPRTFNYLINFNGAIVGWATSTLSDAVHNDKPAVLEKEKTYIAIKRSFDGAEFIIESTTETYYAPDWSELHKVDVTVNGAQTTRIETAWAENITITKTVDKGKPQVTTLKRGEAPVYCTTQAWHVLKKGEMKAGTRLTFQSVEDDDGALIDEVWTVTGRVKRKLADGSVVEGTQIGMVHAGRAATAIMGDDDMPLYYEASSGFAMERVKQIPEPFKPEPVAIRTVMKSNIATSRYLDIAVMDIELAFKHDDGEGIPPLFDENAYHSVKRLDSGYALRLHERRLSDAAKALAYPLAEVPDDVKAMLKATAMCQSDDKDLAAEALKLAKGRKTGAEVARAIIGYVGKRLGFGTGDTGSASAKQAWLERKGDCTEHAALFVALARAAGLPARNVGGIVFISDAQDGMWGYHAWAEVWLGEWVPVDTTVAELGTGARYLMFEYDEPGETHGRGRSGRCLRQDIHPVINHYKLNTGQEWKRHNATDHWKAD